MIQQGEIYWLEEGVEGELANGVSHPHVVVQETALNVSRIDTVVVCALSTNWARAYDVGNVLLEPGEGGLEKQSFVAVGHVSVVSKKSFRTLIGQLSDERVCQILSGMMQRHNSTGERP